MILLYILISIIVILAFIIIFTSIELQIENLEYIIPKAYRKSDLKGKEDYKIIIKLYILGKINYFRINLTKTKSERERIRSNVKKLERKMFQNIDKFKFDIKILKSLQTLKFLNIKLKKLNLKIILGTEDAALTAILIGVIASFIGIILKGFIQNEKTNYWKIEPIYQNVNLLKINLDCIFRVKLIHIIYTIIISKKGGEQNVKSSNRRTYAYSNE